MVVDWEVARVRRLFLSDLAQEKKKIDFQHVTTIIVETQEELIIICTIYGASFCAGARCAPKVNNGVLLVKIYSKINVVWQTTKESIIKIKSYKKRDKSKGFK